MIINPLEGYLLPIELDGAKKTPVEDCDDFLYRQNVLIRSFGSVLRYSNTKMHNNPREIIHEISMALLAQKAAKRRREEERKALGEQAKVAESINPPDVPPAAKPAKSSPSIRPTWRRAMPYVGFALLVTITLLFIWQTRQYSDVREVHASTASIGAKETPPTSVAVPESNSSSGKFILASQAQSYIGQKKLVCGNVVEVKEISEGMFVNLDKPYPKEPMTVVIWRERINNLGHMQFTENSRLCISGLIQAYHGKPQIEVYSREQIVP